MWGFPYKLLIVYKGKVVVSLRQVKQFEKELDKEAVEIETFIPPREVVEVQTQR